MAAAASFDLYVLNNMIGEVTSALAADPTLANSVSQSVHYGGVGSYDIALPAGSPVLHLAALRWCSATITALILNGADTTVCAEWNINGKRGTGPAALLIAEIFAHGFSDGMYTKETLNEVATAADRLGVELKYDYALSGRAKRDGGAAGSASKRKKR